MQTSPKKYINQEINSDEASAVLTKALMRVASLYDLSNKDLATILGTSEATISRMLGGKRPISVHSKEGELAILLIRLFRSLSALVGENHEDARTWLQTYNKYFQSAPLDRIKQVSGLVDAVNYLDAMRAKV